MFSLFFPLKHVSLFLSILGQLGQTKRGRQKLQCFSIQRVEKKERWKEKNAFCILAFEWNVKESSWKWLIKTRKLSILGFPILLAWYKNGSSETPKEEGVPVNTQDLDLDPGRAASQGKKQTSKRPAIAKTKASVKLSKCLMTPRSSGLTQTAYRRKLISTPRRMYPESLKLFIYMLQYSKITGFTRRLD